MLSLRVIRRLPLKLESIRLLSSKLKRLRASILSRVFFLGGILRLWVNPFRLRTSTKYRFLTSD
jgi:hypothetical protein